MLETSWLDTRYDGDMMAVYFILDNEMIRMFEPLRPYRSIPSLSGPHEISDAAEEQGPQTITIYNYLYGAHDKYNRVDF